MKQELNPKVMIVVIAVVVILALGFGYKMLFAPPAVNEFKTGPGAERFAHPSGPDNLLPGQKPSDFK